VAQADSASSTQTATILLKLDLRIGRRIGRNHKRSLARFLNADAGSAKNPVSIFRPTASLFSSSISKNAALAKIAPANGEFLTARL
ncbi:hypothetical protein, partial [Mesorhizobium sp.]|uniref:hypothetical protein n=1 Tax=Mesorhizobium sp. TaxID=1871066 RepID=UPI0025C384FB